MLQIKVFQNGSIKTYVTNTFKEGETKSEFRNFLEVMTNVDLGNKKIIGFEDCISHTKIFLSPVSCLIEIEELVKK